MSFLSIAMMWGGGLEDQEWSAGSRASQVCCCCAHGPLLRTLNWSAAIAFWIGLYFGITSVRDRHRAELRQSELAHALKVAELRVLKSQLNPHFLFNSLNSVRALIADDPTGAQNAVTQVARTLRYTLTAGQEEVVSLERELEIVADYLSSNRCGSVSGCVSSAQFLRSPRRAHSGDAAANHRRECNQARYRRAAAGRRVADRRAYATLRCSSKSRTRALRRPANRRRTVSACTTLLSGCVAVRRRWHTRSRSLGSGSRVSRRSHSQGHAA
jgi:hypothetical protein